ncbi:MAG: tRNA CCA-pyrophosphorylase [Buchnera aphidicola (Nurudea yanoniella)]
MKIYLVGGAVRDKLLHIPIKDRDWVITGATPKMLLNMNFKQVGKDFPVFLHPYSKEEYSLARIDRKMGTGYTGFTTFYCRKTTLQEDLIRRDLTINAIAQDKDGNYIDFFCGLKDLQNRIFRHISLAFCEDPLRIFRIARFSSEFNHFGFQIAQETMKLMINMVKNKELLCLTHDRIWKETKKALNTCNPHVYFQVLYYCNALSLVYPEINIVCQYEFYKIHRYHKNFFIKFNFFFEIAKISNLNKDIDIKFAYLCNMICQFQSKNVRCFLFEIYDEISNKFVKILCKRLCIPSYIKDLSVIFSSFFKFLNFIHFRSAKDIITFFNKIDAWRKPVRVQKLSILIDLYISSSQNINIKNSYQGNFLQSAFNIANQVSIKSILYLGFTGIEIRNELVRLRIIAINKWKKKLNHLKLINAKINNKGE